MEKKTIIDLFESSVKRFPGNPFLWEKTGKRFEPTTYSKVRDLVYEEGAGLVSLGVRKGDNMALLSEGRNAWIIGELAMFYAGATNVPLSIKLEEANDLLFRLVHADVKYIMVSGQQLGKIRAIKDKLPAVRKIIVLDEQAEYQDREMSLSEIRRMGKVYLGIHPIEEFLAIGQSLGNDDYATITYTSGTTADPKGVILTHRNYTANVEQALTCVDIDDTWRTLVILPLDHCFAHVVGFYIFMSKGASVATVQVGRTGMETLKNIPINIKEFKPYLILSVPALAKNFKKNIEQGIRARGKNAVRLFNLALRIGYIYNGDSDEEEGKGFRVLLKPLVRLFDKLLFAKVRENFGGELKFFIGGGALLDKDLQKFYYALGIPMYQGYGLSEATPIISTNGPRRHTFGSSGVLVRPLDLKICDMDGNVLPPGETGEIVIRTDKHTPCGLFMGYYRDEEKTREAWSGGVYHTGDTAWRDEDGYFFYVGRTDDVIKSSGYRIGPFEIESVIMELPYVLECAVTSAPDPIRGQVVKASIVLTKGTQGTEALKKEIQTYVKTNTAPYKYPRIVEFRDELPKTISGKIRRVELKG